MVNMEKVAEKTYRLEVMIPDHDWLYTVYFIDEGRGVLIEPGPAVVIPSIQEAMRQLGMEGLAYIIPTHIHQDHAGAIGKLAELFPQARVVVHPLAARHVVNPAGLIKSTKLSFGNDFELHYGAIIPVSESQVKIAEDGETLSIDGRELQIIYAPGHATHHLAIFDRQTRGLFCGEALGLPMPWAESSPLPLAAPPAFDLEVYLQTIKRLRKLSPRILFYSHDGVGRKPEELISEVAENTRALGDIILSALREGLEIEAIDKRLRDYFYRRFGVIVNEVDRITLEGFIFYFKKNRQSAIL